jgi:pimeloyl-ACP methyl ester carboxylesterase
MDELLPVVMIPGLLTSPRLYGEQIPVLWRRGPVTVANHTRDDTVAAIAQRILAMAPSRFALVGLSMGGYIAFEIMRRAAERVVKLALLDTSARPDTPEQSEQRRARIAMAKSGRFAEIPDLQFPKLVHPLHRDDKLLLGIVRRMADDTGPDAFVRQQTAIMTRPDSRPTLGAIRCPTLVLVGDGDQLTPPDRAAEMASGIIDSRLVILPECGHLSTLEQPRQVSQALTELLEA